MIELQTVDKDLKQTRNAYVLWELSDCLKVSVI